MSETAALPTPSKSNKPIIKTSEVSLKRPMHVLTIGGIEIFFFFFRMIFLVLCQYVKLRD